MSVLIYKKGSTENYVHVDSDTNEVVATYGERVITLPNLSQYTLVEPSKKFSLPDRTSDEKFQLYVSALQAGHTVSQAQVASGYDL